MSETPPAESLTAETESVGKAKSGTTPTRRGRGTGKSAPARSTTRPAKSSGSSSRSSGSSSTDAAGSLLATALRGLVSGIEEEVTAITGLSGEIDTHVQALNDLRAEATRRLLHLDDLRGAAEDVNLSAFLDTSIQPHLPQVEEDFPDRIYGG